MRPILRRAMARAVTRWLATVLLAGTLLPANIAFAQFSNGGFELGTFQDWTQGFARNTGLDGPSCDGPFYSGIDVSNVAIGGPYCGALPPPHDQSLITAATPPETGWTRSSVQARR